jgi:hypothetical protein
MDSAINFFTIVVISSWTSVNSIVPVSSKQSLLNLIDGPAISPTDIFACPESLAPLKIVRRYFGASESVYLLNQEDKETRYMIYPERFIDLTIKREVNRPIWQQSIRERVGQNTFQTPIVSAIYERGWRQQFEVRGFLAHIKPPVVHCASTICCGMSHTFPSFINKYK